MSRWFPNGCVASPHHLASATGQAVLSSGGNAMDAAVAANLVLSVVTPYHCGVGGDLLALVWDGKATGVSSMGAAAAGATPAAIASALDDGHGNGSTSLPGTAGMPTYGALPVTVPGAAAGWHHLLDRWGTRSFGDLSKAARKLAEEGYLVSPYGATYRAQARDRLAAQPGWSDTYGRMRAGERFIQRELAGTLTALADDGPDALYRGPIGTRIVEALQAHGSTLSAGDLAAHRVTEVEPLRGGYRDAQVVEMPPPTQGVTALTALAVLDAWGPLPEDPTGAVHLQIEATKAALADREQYLADPRAMVTTPAELLAADRIQRLAEKIDHRAAAWPPGRPAPGGTAYLCAADGDGLLVSLIQSNFKDFGSGVVPPDTGIGLHNRGAHFSLDPDDPNVIAPGKQPMHTLIPGLVLRDGRPWLVFGTMGGDGQAQTHVQLLGHLVDRGADVQTAIDAPRWLIDVADGGVALEARAPELHAGLGERGHRMRAMEPYDYAAGHAHAIELVDGGYVGGSDPRCEGAVLGW